MSHHTNKSGVTTRHTFNLTASTAAALQAVVDREGVTTTESLRRLVGIGEFIYRAIKEDGATVIVKDGDSTRQVVIL